MSRLMLHESGNLLLQVVRWKECMMRAGRSSRSKCSERHLRASVRKQVIGRCQVAGGSPKRRGPKCLCVEGKVYRCLGIATQLNVRAAR